MATLAELFDIVATNSELGNKIVAASVVYAESILTETPAPSAARLALAESILDEPSALRARLFHQVIGNRSSNTKAQIEGANDTTIQADVDAAIDLMEAPTP